MKRFLQFVVEETLEDHAQALKEYTIAVEVFERDESFDPTTSALVRVEAGRLRRTLKQYYLTYGRDDEVTIEVRRGGYVPRFFDGKGSARERNVTVRGAAAVERAEGPAPIHGFTERPASGQPLRSLVPADVTIKKDNGAAIILVVDDEPQVEALISQRFRRRVRDGTLAFLFARDGEQALDVLLSNANVDLVLTDINMPRMDGLTLLDHLDHINPLLMAVVVSAYDDMENIRTAMNRGAFDFITKPIDFDDLSITIDKTLAHRTILQEARQEHDQLEALRKELAIASRIQQSFRPVELPNSGSFSLFGATKLAREVGGDFFDYFPIQDGRIAVVIAEVSGNGVPAALGAAVCRAALRTSAVSAHSPQDCVRKLNALFCQQSGSSVTASLMFASIDTTSGAIDFVNAGHKLPYILKSGGEIELVEVPYGTMLGTDEEATFESRSLALSPGEVLFLYTDGMTNIFDSHRHQFSIERLEEALIGAADQPVSDLVDHLMSAVESFVGEADYEDDLTCLAIKREK
jgi:sigma-B regulation protein RsbU (phosphoserine phosphatase)